MDYNDEGFYNGLEFHKLPLIYQDLTKRLGIQSFNLEVVDYREIINNNDILQYFKNAPAIILFYPLSDTFGHFVGLTFYNNIINYYDPYGGNVDYIKKYNKVDSNYQEIYNTLSKLLYDLYRNNNIEIHFNEYKHQSMRNKSATCGRWCALRCALYFLDTKEFNKAVNRLYLLSGDKDKDWMVYNMTKNII